MAILSRMISIVSLWLLFGACRKGSHNIDWPTIRKTIWTGTLYNYGGTTQTLDETIADYDAIVCAFGLSNWSPGPNTTDTIQVVTPNRSHSASARPLLSLTYGYSGGAETRLGMIQIANGTTIGWDTARSKQVRYTSGGTSVSSATDSSNGLVLVRVEGLKYS